MASRPEARGSTTVFVKAAPVPKGSIVRQCHVLCFPTLTLRRSAAHFEDFLT
jgi:hypothetical protein